MPPLSTRGPKFSSSRLAAAAALVAGSVALAASPAAAQLTPAPGAATPVALPIATAPALAAPSAGVRGRIVRRAIGQLGYKDHGHFCTKYGPCEVWCSLFASWVWRGAGIPIGSLPFTGSMYDWAASSTYVLRSWQRPKPGDAVLFGTGPNSVDSSLHVGIVEDVYPGYIVTVEGDTNHQVRRFVVPAGAPQQIGEPGPIYAYASPVPRAGATRRTAAPGSAARPLPPGALRRAIANQDGHMKLTPTDIRLRNTIRSLRAFQHMPYRSPTAKIGWFGVNPLGQIEVAVVSHGDLAGAELAWQDFLARFGDDGAAYAVSFYTAAP